MSCDLRRLSLALQHDFATPELLRAALTHRSAGGENNERLEFLGDAVLSLVIAEALHHERPEAREGELSRLRATLVKKPTLAEIANELSLGEHLRLGPGELKSGGFRRTSILADALEAVFGAIYLDSGYRVVRDCILRLFAERLATLPSASELKDPKSRLQELLQSRGAAIPRYRIERVEGEAHEQRFTVVCELSELGLRELGEGSSRQRAEQRSARRMLARLKREQPGGV